MSDSRIHRFGACELRLFPATRYCETVFGDGTKAPATRCSTMQNIEYARHLGYDDTWPALVEHEALHTWTAERMGHTVSPTLWAVAHGYAEGTAPYEEQLAEEALVLAVQRYRMTGERLSILDHPDVAPHLDGWLVQIQRLAAQLLARTDEVA